MLEEKKNQSSPIIIIDKGNRFAGSEVYVSHISSHIKIHITSRVCFY